jgi:hypothetical protein
MTPTMRLRFVEREELVDSLPEYGVSRTRVVRVLQQWWEYRNIMLAVHITDKDGNTLPPPARGEWRDVPLEREA